MTTLVALLGSSGKRHLAAVAEQLGLPASGSASEVAASLLDRDRLTGIADGLGAGARALALRAVLDPGPARLRGGPHADLEALTELEHHGLAFCFGDRWWREYRVPDDLRAPLQCALAARHAGGLTEAKAKRWLARRYRACMTPPRCTR